MSKFVERDGAAGVGLMEPPGSAPQSERRREAAEESVRRGQAESFRFEKAELERQSAATSHPVRREQIALAIVELDRRLAEV